MDSPSRGRAANRTGRLLADEAYDRIRSAITSGEYRPREPLIEADLAERFGIGRTPIRECMQRLAAQGLVTRRRRGWAVHELSHEEIRELYEVRAGLEALAARLVAERASDEMIEEIARAHDTGEDLTHAPRARLVEVNNAFHSTMVGAAGNRKLAEFVQQSREHFFTYRVMYVFSDVEVAKSNAGHERIIKALRERDADAAERSAREHVLSAAEVVLANSPVPPAGPST